MKKTKLLSFGFLILTALLLLSGCGDDPSQTDQQYYLNVTKTEGEGEIIQAGQQFPEETVITLESNTKEGWEITEANGKGVIKENGKWKVLMNEDRYIQVVFGLKTYNVEEIVDISSLGRIDAYAVQEPPEVENLDLDFNEYAHGTIVEFKAEPSTYSSARFSEWQADAAIHGSQNPIRIEITENMTVEAEFLVGETITSP
jgi:hypothetical protein